MRTGKTLVELATEIQRQANAKKDFIAPTEKMAMLPDGRLALDYMPVSNIIPLKAKADALQMNSLAHSQLAEYTSIPKQYYDTMARVAPSLLATNVNHWLGTHGGERRLVRTLDGNVRSINSDRFRPLENSDLAEAVLPVLMEMDLFIASCEVTERKMYIKCFDKRIEREIKAKGSDPAHTFLKDVVFPSITIANSEVGCGALDVAAGIYTGGCTNFASFSDTRMRKYHVGGKALDSADVYALLSDDTKRKTDAAIWAQTRDVVKSAFDIARFEALVARIQDTAEQKIEGNVLKVVEVTGQTFGFNKTEQQSILQHLINGGNLSRYGMFNAITRAAEDMEDYERATDFERVGGKVIELPRHDWERIAKAA